MYKGKLTPVATEERGKIHTVFVEQVQKHSQKPEISYEIINRLYPNLRKLELYARKERNGIDCWGNEVPVTETKEESNPGEMTLDEFQEKYCQMCGTQRCGGVYDEVFRDGCSHYQREILGQLTLEDLLKEINEV